MHGNGQPLTYRQQVMLGKREAARRCLSEALQRCGSVRKAAKEIGLRRPDFYRECKQYGVKIPDRKRVGSVWSLA